MIDTKKNHHTQRYVDFDTVVISFAYTLRRVTRYFDHRGAKPTMTVHIIRRALLFKYILFWHTRWQFFLPALFATAIVNLIVLRNPFNPAYTPAQTLLLNLYTCDIYYYIELPTTTPCLFCHWEPLIGARNVFDKRAWTNFKRQYVKYNYTAGQKLNYVLNINLCIVGTYPVRFEHVRHTRWRVKMKNKMVKK